MNIVFLLLILVVAAIFISLIVEAAAVVIVGFVGLVYVSCVGIKSLFTR